LEELPTSIFEAEEEIVCLEMDKEGSLQISVSVYQTTRNQIQADCMDGYCRKNLKLLQSSRNVNKNAVEHTLALLV
jgi:hypothetical protein